MPATAFPTEFPSDAAAKIGKAILSQTFTVDLIEPAYDLLGYIAYRLLVATPFPKPTVSSNPGDLPADDFDHTDEQVGRMLVEAGERHAVSATLGADGDKEGVLALLPWKTIAQMAANILLGLLLAAEPNPFVPPDQADA
jgi:hypothetical protein